MDRETDLPLIPSKFIDFYATDIQHVATEHAYTYTEQEKLLATERNLYENPRTDGLQIHKLRIIIDSLPCEFYTSWYLPVSAASGGLQQTTESYNDTSRMNVQVFSISLPYLVEDLYVQSKLSLNLGSIIGLAAPFKQSNKVQLEGSFNRFFNVYTPKDEELNAFTILAPNIMAKLITDGSNYDFEFSGNKIYFYSTPGLVQPDTISMTKANYDAMLQFGLGIARQLARAGRPSKRNKNEQNTAMWQLYDPSKAALSLMFKVMIGFLIISIPLLWIIGVYWIVKYLRKRAALLKLQQQLKNDMTVTLSVK